jgi:1,4-alpha-glucan branching enzyme
VLRAEGYEDGLNLIYREPAGRPPNTKPKTRKRKAVAMARKTKQTMSKSAQVFSFTAPAATSVQLVGDFTHWQEQPINLRKEPDGIWRVSVKLPPGAHHYRFLVDGEWLDDPECLVRVPTPFGSHNAVRQIA